MNRQIDKLIEHIRELEVRLGEVDNNLRYIKVVQALKHSLEKLDNMLKDNTALQRFSSSASASSFDIYLPMILEGSLNAASNGSTRT